MHFPAFLPLFALAVSVGVSAAPARRNIDVPAAQADTLRVVPLAVF